MFDIFLIVHPFICGARPTEANEGSEDVRAADDVPAGRHKCSLL